jgi:DNA-binding IclR family transcriptional regulator
MANNSLATTRGANGEGASVEAVDRAARVLFALAARPVPSTLAEIAQRADLTKPTAFRILASLIAEGLAAQNAQTGAYRLGSTPLRLATSVLQNVAVREPALIAMRKIRDEVNETVVLSVREGDLRYNIDSVEAINAIAQAHRIGVPIPLYTGAASRVLLAGMESEELLSYLGRTELVAYSEATIVDRGALMEELARVGAQGYAVSSGEFTSAGHAVAIAIRDGDGRAIAALHVSVPRSRYSQTVEDRCVAALRQAVATIEAAMAAKAA